MATYVALLRAINVGGRNLVAMSDLRELFAVLKLSGAQSVLQSGNVIFQSDERNSAALERRLEIETEKRLKVAVDYVVRSAEEWKTIVARNPFPKQAKLDPSHLVVAFLKEAPETRDVKALQAAIRGPEVLKALGKQLYIVYPAGIGRSKLTNTLIEKTLGTRGTARNWNTVLKLDALTQ